MKTEVITLARPAMVHDVMRYPVEGSLTVTPDEVNRLKLAGVLVDDDGDGDDDSLSSKNKTDLMLIVTKEGVPLHGATKVADIVAAIERHRTYKNDGLAELDLAAADKDRLLVIAAYEGATVPQGDAATDDELRKAITDHRAAG